MINLQEPELILREGFAEGSVSTPWKKISLKLPKLLFGKDLV